MPPPSFNRLGTPRSESSNKGSRPLAMHRGAAPKQKGARLAPAGAATRSSKARFLTAPFAAVAKDVVSRALLAPPVKPRAAVAPLPPPKQRIEVAPLHAPKPQPKPVVVAAPKPTLRVVPAPVVIDPSPLPPRVSPVKLLTNNDRNRWFGHIHYKAAPSAGNPERIIVEGGWASSNIVGLENTALHRVTIPSPDPLLAPTGILGLPNSIPFHRLVANHFEELALEWEKAGLLHLIKSWNGSYVPRFRRGQAEKQVLSAHSWGSAFDINARWNGYRQHPAEIGEEGSVILLVAIANELGWVWGGDFSTPDGMHFEAGAKLLGLV